MHFKIDFNNVISSDRNKKLYHYRHFYDFCHFYDFRHFDFQVGNFTSLPVNSMIMGTLNG
jgi:hypothetical protein